MMMDEFRQHEYECLAPMPAAVKNHPDLFVDADLKSALREKRQEWNALMAERAQLKDDDEKQAAYESALAWLEAWLDEFTPESRMRIAVGARMVTHESIKKNGVRSNDD